MRWCLSLGTALAAVSILVAATPGLAYEPARQTNEMEGYTSNPILTRAGAAAQAKKLAAFEDF